MQGRNVNSKSTLNEQDLEPQVTGFQLSQKTLSELDIRLVNTIDERNKLLAENYPSHVESLKLNKNTVLKNFTRRQIGVVEVNVAICTFDLFEATQKQFHLTDAALISAYREAVEDRLSKLFGVGGYKLNMYVHFRTKEQSENVLNNFHRMDEICSDIDTLTTTDLYRNLAQQHDQLVATNSEWKKKWNAALAKDLAAQKNRCNKKSLPFDEVAEIKYYTQLCNYYRIFLLSKAPQFNGPDNVKVLRDRPVALLLTNDVHPDNVLEFAKASLSSFKLPSHLAANGFIYVPMEQLDLKQSEPQVQLVISRKLPSPPEFVTTPSTTAHVRESLKDISSRNSSDAGYPSSIASETPSLSSNRSSSEDEEAALEDLFVKAKKIPSTKVETHIETRQFRLFFSGNNFLTTMSESPPKTKNPYDDVAPLPAKSKSASFTMVKAE